MKIGIITYHFARNYGAILQCFALQSHLKMLGQDVRVLNYETERQERNNSLHHKRDNPLQNLAINIALLPFERARKLKEGRFSGFEADLLLESPRLRSLDELSSYVESEGLDILISGSDQVFNPKIDDFDRAFLFPFQTTAVKASFAASLGSATAEELVPYVDDLRAFDVVCVRERTDAAVAESLLGKKPLVADDPVFLLGPNDWRSVASTKGSPKGGYVLGYFINKACLSQYVALTHAIAERLGLPVKVINVRFGKDSFKSEMVKDAGPAEFLGLVSGASFVCTDSFHGTAFSLIFERPFVSFEPRVESSDYRKRDLLEKVGQKWRSLPIDISDVENKAVGIADNPDVSSSEGLSLIRANQDNVLAAILGEER
ncbi:polysaccharide pyruvyl transferase family protein [Olsenella sp. AM04-33]|uniref:polysaccharide pyruvyl transferase family protein n=1 Tax=Olsenella sp. AM04-33 TaxID=2292049 RepID=UPI000E5032CD|nr:polysaccharide pyruvyl transferase family protein [Olsenella sp. AM04-33]RHK02231.1 polysaccharide pyruvyl transferase family protein [Olsenella sp. AM04-33]